MSRDIEFSWPPSVRRKGMFWPAVPLVGPPSNGNKLDKKVLDEFLDGPERMHRYAQSLRQAAERDEIGNVSQLVGDEYESVLEGRYLLRLHRVWERKPALREKKIRSVQARGDSLACEACGFDFELTYGDRGQGFIECHHVENALRPSAI
ncbi:MAG TPA: hypothetical protein VJY33_03735 [Isosphaeraceae bacterium]|nr:hypothetical protein [Isosphaeraceae bacterium]